MSLYAALILALSPVADAPHAMCDRAVAIQHAGHGHTAACRAHRAHSVPRVRAPSGLRAGDPVRLDGAFFQAAGAGGVGLDPLISAPARRYSVIASPHGGAAARLRSARREAARRGLPRP